MSVLSRWGALQIESVSGYEIVSLDLRDTYPDGFELPVDDPIVTWRRRHRAGSLLRAADWEAFSDPRRTTYRSYTALQNRKEDVVDGLLREIDETGYDERLSADWVAFVDRWYAPLRFPAYGLQMLAASVGHAAPASRITSCATFQVVDEMRRLQWIAHRSAQLAAHGSAIDVEGHRRTWERAAELQPLRELIERALVTDDWGETFVLTNVVLKPHLDRLVNGELAGALATANGDHLLASLHFSLDDDAKWHRRWTEALLRVAIGDTPANTDVVLGWVDRWRPLVVDAVASLAGVAAQAPVPADPAAITGRIIAAAALDANPVVDAALRDL